MKVKFTTAKIGGEERRLVYTTQAHEEVLEKYGNLENFKEAIGISSVDESGEGKTKRQRMKSVKELNKAYDWLITLLLNQGIEIDNFENGKQAPLLTEKAVRIYLAPHERPAMKTAVLESFLRGLLSEEARASAKDQDEDEVLTEIKNGEGAAAE